jgi:hypothetical protein
MAAHAHHAPRRRRCRVAVAALVAGLFAVGACTGDGDAGAPTTETAAATSTAAAEPPAPAPDDDAPVTAPPGCLAADAIADIVGEPVEVSASGGGRATTDGISYSSTGCSYRLDDGGSVGVERVSWDGDGFAFDGLSDDARTTAEEDGFEPVDDLGDEAWRDGTTIAVLDDDAMILAEVDPAPGDGTEVAGALGEVLAGAVVGLDLAPAPGDHPCTTVEAAVADALGPVASSQASAGGRVIDDVQLTTTGCRLDLVDGAEATVGVADAADWDPWVAAMQAHSSDTGYAPFTIGQVSAFDTGAALVVDDGDEPLRITTEDLDVDPDVAADLRLAVADLALAF